VIAGEDDLMTYGFLDTRTTPAVRAAQDANGVGGFWEEMEVDLPQDRSPNARRPSLPNATVSTWPASRSPAWPNIQH
jgi:hypothetical protein